MTNTENLKNENFKTEHNYLLTSENFNLLCESQKRIKEETGLSPTLRMLINKILNFESIEKLTKRIIGIWKSEKI